MKIETRSGRVLTVATLGDVLLKALGKKIETSDKPWQQMTSAEKEAELKAHGVGRLRPIKDGRKPASAGVR